MQTLPLTAAERAVACTPDTYVWWAPAVEGLRALGQLLDNWANVAVEIVSGWVIRAHRNANRPVRLDDDGKDVYEAIRPSGSRCNAAMTDGRDVVYRPEAESDIWSLQAWPFDVDVKHGIASPRCCRLTSTTAAELDGDARVPLRGRALPPALRDSPPLPERERRDRRLPAGDAARHPLCRGRVGAGVLARAGQGHVAALLPPPGGAGVCRGRRRRPGHLRRRGGSAVGAHDRRRSSVRAAVVRGRGGRVCRGAVSVLPVLHGPARGAYGAQNITMYNARTWDEFVSVRQMDCAVEKDDGVLCETPSETGAFTELLTVGVRAAARVRVLADLVCPRRDRRSFLALDSYGAESPVVKQKKNVFPAGAHGPAAFRGCGGCDADGGSPRLAREHHPSVQQRPERLRPSQRAPYSGE